ncbi:MAG: PD-(D/E)XK nuclease family transposase [Bacillota bacterium]
MPARTAQGILISIEVQVTNKYDIGRRALFYWARL